MFPWSYDHWKTTNPADEELGDSVMDKWAKRADGEGSPNRFRKLEDGNWGIMTTEPYAEGEECLVERKDGTCELLRVGQHVMTTEYGEQVYRIGRSGRKSKPVKPAPPAGKPLPDDDLPF